MHNANARNKPKLPMKMRLGHVNTLIIRTATFNSGKIQNSSCFAMAQDVSTEKVNLQQVRGAEYVYSHLNDRTNDRTKNSNDQKIEQITNDLANKLLRVLGEKDALECLTLLEGGHDTVLSEYENFQNARKPTRKSSRGKGDFTATVGIAARKY